MSAAVLPARPAKASAFRPADASDLPRVIELLGHAFGVASSASFLQPDIVQWKYWEPREDWTEPRSYVLERGGRLVGHAGLWPAVVRADGKEWRGIHMIDWAAEPSSTGVGIALLQRLLGMFDFVYSIGGSEHTAAILPALGFQVVSESWTAARPLRPFRMRRGVSGGGWKPAARFIRNVAWSTHPFRRHSSGWRCEQVDLKEIPVPSGNRGTIERPAGYFRYLERCPGARCLAYRVFRGGEPRGSFALLLVNHQARLASVWHEPSDRAARRAIYELAQATALEEDAAAEMCAMGSGDESARDALAAGLRIRGRRSVYRSTNRKHPECNAIDLEYQLSDFDGVFSSDDESPFLC